MSWNKRRWACLLLALMTALPGVRAEEAAPAEETASATIAPAQTAASTPAAESPAGEATPSAGENTPGAGEETPGAGENTPGTGETTPGAGEETPGAGETTPGAGEEIPGAGETTPGVGEETPGAGEEIPGVTPVPSPEESPAPTPEPGDTPAPSGALNLVAEGATRDADGAWQFTYSPELSEICFNWSAVEGAQCYACEISDEHGATVYAVQTTDCRLSLPATDYLSGSYALRVQAVAEDAILAEESLRFSFAQSGFPGGGRPSGGFGGFGGGRPSGGASGGAPEAEQGFHITPGEALTSRHASGTKDMQLYGTVALEPADAPVVQLTLGGAELPVVLDGGDSAFTAVLEGETLVLTPEAGGATWTVNARALEILNRSGAAELTLRLDGGDISLSTALEFQGAAYAALRAQGYVSGDFNLCADASGLRVEVDGQTYLLNENGELIAP